MILILWLSLIAVLVFGVVLNERDSNTKILSSAPPDGSPVFPIAWIPPFAGYSWVVEEVIKQPRLCYRAKCDPKLIGYFEYEDETLNKTVAIMFVDGVATAWIKSLPFKELKK